MVVDKQIATPYANEIGMWHDEIDYKDEEYDDTQCSARCTLRCRETRRAHRTGGNLDRPAQFDIHCARLVGRLMGVRVETGIGQEIRAAVVHGDEHLARLNARREYGATRQPAAL